MLSLNWETHGRLWREWMPILEKGNFTSQDFFIKSSYRGQRRQDTMIGSKE